MLQRFASFELSHHCLIHLKRIVCCHDPPLKHSPVNSRSLPHTFYFNFLLCKKLLETQTLPWGGWKSAGTSDSELVARNPLSSWATFPCEWKVMPTTLRIPPRKARPPWPCGEGKILWMDPVAQCPPRDLPAKSCIYQMLCVPEWCKLWEPKQGEPEIQ